MAEIFASGKTTGVNGSKVPYDFCDKDTLRTPKTKILKSDYTGKSIVILPAYPSFVAEEPYSYTSPVLHNIRGVSSIDVPKASGLAKKIIFGGKGEIEFIARGNRLDIYARKYSNKKTETTVHITKRTGQYSARHVLANAVTSVENRIAEAEMQLRWHETKASYHQYRLSETEKKRMEEERNKRLMEEAKARAEADAA